MHIVNLPESFVENDLSKSSRRHFEKEENFNGDIPIHSTKAKSPK